MQSIFQFFRGPDARCIFFEIRLENAKNDVIYIQNWGIFPLFSAQGAVRGGKTVVKLHKKPLFGGIFAQNAHFLVCYTTLVLTLLKKWEEK